MSCVECQALFGRKLDDRLTAEQARVFEAHLAACASCSAELERWRASSRALRAAGPADVPIGLAERAWRGALCAGEAPGFLERFVAVGRKVALAGVFATATAWAGVLMSGGTSTSEPLPRDAVEVAASVWSMEVLDE